MTSLNDLVDDFKKDLCYVPYPMPTFFLQSRNGLLAQGSCRRPGAHGPDAFRDFDALLIKSCRDPAKRPAALFLGGDQIYADDVAYSLFEAVRALTPDIMGYDEYLPLAPSKGNQSTLVKAEQYWFSFLKGETDTRKPVVLSAGLTTDDGEGHLMTFGEFAAMYLLVWNPTLCKSYRVEELHSMKSSDFRNLKDFTQRVAEARRAFANIPVYMAFDDHEITDDWNLDADWVKQTDTNLARRILTNGLVACWLFQAWGNSPELTGNGEGPRTTLSIERRLDAQRKAQGTAIDETFEKALLAREPWAYVAPTKPPVIVTDLRTHREFSAPAGSLLNRNGYTHLTNICRGLPPNEPAVLLTGTPVLPWEPIMFLRNIKLFHHKGYTMKWVTGPSRKERNEFEYGDMWLDYPQGRANFVQWVHDTLKPSYCVVFSGDVHHGFVVKGNARLQLSQADKLQLWSLDIVQITSSPIKNEHGDLRNKKMGVSVAEVLDTWLPTAGKVEASTSDGHWMEIPYDAIGLTGRLVQSDSVVTRAIFGTLLFRNHMSVVDFTDPKRVAVNFIGHGKVAEGSVRV